MSPKSIRAQRLMDLYALRTRVVTEIAEIETAVQREAENVSRLRGCLENKGKPQISGPVSSARSTRIAGDSNEPRSRSCEVRDQGSNRSEGIG